MLYITAGCVMQTLPMMHSAREVVNNLFFSEKRYDLGDVGRYRINRKLNLTTDMDVPVAPRKILSKLSNISSS